jgi:predicted ATP-grasp superfamily ATP-dependent carboligase
MTNPPANANATTAPAIVLGAGINGLGVARSLARAGVPTWLADSDPTRAELKTRAARPLTIAALNGDALIDELVRLGETQFAGQRPALLMTQEETVRTVSNQRARLAGLYRFNLPSIETVEALQHKFGFQELAERYGAPIPPLVRVRDAADLERLATLHYPVVVKPGTRDDAYGHRFKKAYRIDGAAAATALVQAMLPVLADVVVQEWTEGPDANIYFCLQHLDARGEVTASFTGHKVRAWPPQVGGTASCAPAPDADAELAALTTKFFRAAGVVGLAAMEYKRDVRTGAFRMVEPTIGRTDYQAEIATLNGVNLPYAAWCAAVSLPPPAAPTTVTPLAWRVRSEDIQSAARQQQSIRDGFASARRVVDALWRWNDPQPAIAQAAHRVAQALRHRTARLRPVSQSAGTKP